jgi:hypothetical protein
MRWAGALGTTVPEHVLSAPPIAPTPDLFAPLPDAPSSLAQTASPPPALQLAKHASIYVNDAFGTAHRAHASTEGVTKFLSPSVAGFLLQKELDYLGEPLVIYFFNILGDIFKINGRCFFGPQP